MKPSPLLFIFVLLRCCPGMANHAGENDGSTRPSIAIVNSQPFHLEIVAGLVDATSRFRDSTTFLLAWGGRNLGFDAWIQDVKCKLPQYCAC